MEKICPLSVFSWIAFGLYHSQITHSGLCKTLVEVPFQHIFSDFKRLLSRLYGYVHCWLKDRTGIAVVATSDKLSAPFQLVIVQLNMGRNIPIRPIRRYHSLMREQISHKMISSQVCKGSNWIGFWPSNDIYLAMGKHVSITLENQLCFWYDKI